MQKSFVLKISILSGVLTILAITIWLLTAKPVLVEWYYGINFGSVCEPPFVILNPLRDRQAETSAAAFLSKLKSGKLEVLDEIVFEPEERDRIKDSESKAKINSWFFSDRQENGRTTGFTYWIERDFGGGCQSMPAAIEVKNDGNDWRVVSYSPTY